MDAEKSRDADDEYALIVRQKSKPQQVLVRYLTLLLNYRYGLDIIVVDNFIEAFSIHQKFRERIRCAFIVHNTAIGNKASIAPLSMEGSIPLFLLLPQSLIEEHKALCYRMENVHFCAWEGAFSHTASSLHKVIADPFADQGIGDLFNETGSLSGEESERFIQHRLKNLRTLPTIPEIALRIMRMTEDSQTTVEDLEEVLTSDPAIVHKLIQVVSSAIFAGTSHKEDWTLQEAIVRLGRKQVGGIALQVKLMNSLVCPEESEFDLSRFWRHSVGCALIADRLCKKELSDLEISFNDYWIGALLHDIGKLVLGFFFWNHFEDVLEKMKEINVSFREAEIKLGDFANHEFLGKVLLYQSQVSKNLIKGVGAHNTLGNSPNRLTCLLHLANEISKELGLGYLPWEKPSYNPQVLSELKFDQEELARLVESLGAEIVKKVDDLIERCLGDS